jgi:hypothetical protein
MTADSVERRLHGVAIYNPDLLSKHELVAQFVARQELLDQIVADLHRPGFNQHQIIVGTRGMGKPPSFAAFVTRSKTTRHSLPCGFR